jgi:branched-chain amino acid transport system permease protein
VLLFTEGRFKPYPLFFSKVQLKIGETVLSPSYLAGMVAVLILFLMLSAYFKYTRKGLGMRAAAEDHQIARSKGINLNQVFGLSWAMCAMLCSLGGILLGMITGAASFYLGVLGLKAFPVVLVAGLESLAGCIIVGPMIGIVEILSASYISPYIPWKTFEEVAPYLVLLIILILKPYGFFGLKEIERI